MRNWRSRSCFKGQHLIQKESAEGRKPARSSLLLYHIAPRFSVHQGHANCFCSWISDTHTPRRAAFTLRALRVTTGSVTTPHTLSQTLGESLWVYPITAGSAVLFSTCLNTLRAVPHHSQGVFAVISCSHSQLYWLEDCRVSVGAGLGSQQPGHSQCHTSPSSSVSTSLTVTALRDPCKGTSKQGWDNSSTKQKHPKATL